MKMKFWDEVQHALWVDPGSVGFLPAMVAAMLAASVSITLVIVVIYAMIGFE